MKPLTYFAISCLLLQFASLNAILSKLLTNGITINLTQPIELKQPIQVDYRNVAGIVGDALNPMPAAPKKGK